MDLLKNLEDIMKPKIITVCLFSSILCSTAIFAEPSIVDDPLTAEKPSILDVKKNSTYAVEQALEMKLIKAKLEVIQSDQDRIISTIFWEMNSFIAIIFAGFGVIGYMRYLSDQNAKAIEEEALNKEREANLKEIKRDSKEYINKLKESIVEENISPVENSLESLKTQLKYELSLIKLYIHNAKRENFLNTGKFDNALYESTQELVTSLESKFGGFVKSALLKIAADLKSILELPPSGRNFNVHIRLLLNFIEGPLDDARLFASTYNYEDVNPLVETIESMMNELLSEYPDNSGS